LSPRTEKSVVFLAFQGKWMTADVWSEVIVKHYKLSDFISFNDNQLFSALGLKKSL
jgi:hypothetical protein